MPFVSCGMVANKVILLISAGMTPGGKIAKGLTPAAFPSEIRLKSASFRIRGSTPEYSRRKTGIRAPMTISAERASDPTLIGRGQRVSQQRVANRSVKSIWLTYRST